MIQTMGEIQTLKNRKVVATLEKEKGQTFVHLKEHIKIQGGWIPEKTAAIVLNGEAWARFKELVNKIDQALMKTGKRKGRFGVIAVQKGFVTLTQVIDALGVQAKENLTSGKHRHIGQILLGQGLMSRSQLNEVLQTLKQTRQD